MSALSAEELAPISPALREDGHSAFSTIVLKRGFKFHLMPCFGVEYKRRFLVLRGRYLFRFAGPKSKKAKGVALDVLNFNVHAVDDEQDDRGEILPFAFKLVSLRKTYLFAVESESQRAMIVLKIQEAKERAIKQNLGHASMHNWEREVNREGERLERIKDLQEDMEQRNRELNYA